MVCVNNLKQIGYACHAYADVNGNASPPGGSVVGSAKEPLDRLGVFVSLLPYMEQGALYKKIDLTRGWADQK